MLTAHFPAPLPIRDMRVWVPAQFCLSNIRISSVSTPLPLKLILPKPGLLPALLPFAPRSQPFKDCAYGTQTSAPPLAFPIELGWKWHKGQRKECLNSSTALCRLPGLLSSIINPGFLTSISLRLKMQADVTCTELLSRVPSLAHRLLPGPFNTTFLQAHPSLLETSGGHEITMRINTLQICASDFITLISLSKLCIM